MTRVARLAVLALVAPLGLTACPPPQPPVGPSGGGSTAGGPAGGEPTGGDPVAAPTGGSGGGGVPAALSPALAPLAAWWQGAWSPHDSQGYEFWVGAGGAFWGININGAMHRTTWEVMVVDDGEGKGAPDGQLRLIAMPGGARPTEFRATDVTADAVTFANPSHDAPKQIRYQKRLDELIATLDDGKDLRWVSTPWKSAPELEDADRAFAAAVAAGGIDAWVAGFADDGAQVLGAERYERDEIAGAMGPVLAGGTLTWEPVASHLDSMGIGFTVGIGTYTAANPADSWRSSYATIWVKRKGTWKVMFDTGRLINE
jgi:hypothetical protein